MKFNVLYLFLIVSISGVIGSDSDDNDSSIIINNKPHKDVPTASTLPSDLTTTASTTTSTDKTTTQTTPSTTTSTTPQTTTTTAATTTTVKPTTPTTTTTTAPTTKPTISTSTESTTAVPTSAPSHKGRKFDGPSFIGGIILASGLMAICFVSWKFYKARTERNYHTL